MRHLGRMLAFGSVLALVLTIATSEVGAQKKKDPKAKDYPVATDDDYKSIQKQKELKGTIVSLSETAVTLRVDYPHLEANPKYKPPKNDKNAASNQAFQMWRTYNDLQAQMQKAALAKTPREAAQIQQRIAQDLARLQQQYAQFYAQASKAAKLDPNNMPFITVVNTKDFDLEVQDKVVYRKMVLPIEYDDTGNIKTYTDKEKAELRGDDKTKPGYAAKLDEIMPGAEVKLSLTPPKKKAKDKDKDADKDDKDKMPDEVQRPTVNMIVMTKEAPPSTSAGDDKKKRKNN
jgi:hypothetical protein